LGAGDYFGEVALNFNKRRTASVFCAKDTELMVLDKDDYLAILKLASFGK